jgi:hypothetical protein
MKMTKPGTSTKTGDQSAAYGKETGGKVVKGDNKMDQHMPKSKKSDDKSGQGEHAVKSFATSAAHAKGKDKVRHMAEAILESGDVEGTLAALIRELQEAGVEL